MISAGPWSFCFPKVCYCKHIFYRILFLNVSTLFYLIFYAISSLSYLLIAFWSWEKKISPSDSSWHFSFLCFFLHIIQYSHIRYVYAWIAKECVARLALCIPITVHTLWGEWVTMFANWMFHSSVFDRLIGGPCGLFYTS